MREAELQDAVMQAAAWGGWTLRYHTFDSRRSTAGFPDIVLVRPSTRELLVAELKSTRGRLSAVQAAWIDGLRQTGVECHLWYPADLDAAVARLVGDRVARITRPAR